MPTSQVEALCLARHFLPWHGTRWLIVVGSKVRWPLWPCPSGLPFACSRGCCRENLPLSVCAGQISSIVICEEDGWPLPFLVTGSMLRRAWLSHVCIQACVDRVAICGLSYCSRHSSIITSTAVRPTVGCLSWVFGVGAPCLFRDHLLATLRSCLGGRCLLLSSPRKRQIL